MMEPNAASEARRQLIERLRRSEVQPVSMAAEPLNSRPPDAPVPLSPSQKQVWFHSQLATGVPAYNEGVTIHKWGPLDPKVLERCFNEIVRRHEIWRSAFVLQDGKLIQRIDSSLSVPLPFHDLSHLPTEDREAEAVRLATEDVRRRFDPSVAPLFRVRLVRLAEDYHRIYLTLHHLVFDGVSIYRVLIRELAALYKAYSARQASPLPELAVQYGDYALWQDRQLANGSHAGQLKYWRDSLSGELPSLELPTDRPRPAAPTWHGGMETCTIAVPLVDALKELSRREGATPYMTLLAAFQILLYRYSGQDEILVGGATNMRSRPEFEPLIGYFLNTVVYRSSIDADISFREFLGHVKNNVIGALAHSDIPFDAVVRELAPQRDTGRHPLFQALFSMRPPFTDFPEGWDVTDMEVHSGASSFDLFVEFSEHPHGLAGRFVYSTDLFDRATILRLSANFQVLLKELLRDPDQAVSRVSMLSAEERNTLLLDWNDTRKSFPSLLIHELFETQEKARPNHPALVYRGRELSYAELNTRSNKLANYLREKGAARGSLVGIYLERSLEMVVALLAVLKSGAAYVPYDPDVPLSRLNMMLADSQPVCLLTQQQLRGNLAEYSGETIVLDLPADGLEGQSGANLGIDIAPLDAIYAIYTSGSTGVPKAAINTHKAVSNRILWMQDEYPIQASDRILQKTPYTFDVSVWEFFWPLACGATLVIAEPGGHRDPAYLANLIHQERITTLHFVPSMLREFLEHGNTSLCSSLRRVFSSGEALPPDVKQKFFQRLGAELHNLYGPTEAAVDVTYWNCANQSPCATVPIGRPIANVKAYILDRNLEPVPIGASGELYLGGVALASGYLNRPELTRERFIADPFDADPSARLYKTGDRTRFLADGNIEYLGRLDNQVKLRGFRIETGEIESAILQCDRVQAAVVVMREDSKLGKYLAGYVVPTTSGLDSQAIRGFLKERLPDYMIPSHFVFLDTLPLLSSGKVSRKALPTPHLSPVEDEQYVAPADDTERKLVAIWEELLGVHPIGVNQNFFEMGGHSMLLARLLFQMEQAFHQRLSMALVFQRPTIAGLAHLLRTEKASEQPRRVFPIQPSGTLPPFICLGAGAYCLPLTRHLGSDQPVFGVDISQLEVDKLPQPITLQDIGAYVVKAIREFQPHGPYYLGGWCLWGVLMYEVAQQLMAEGGEVALLVLIDSLYPAHKKKLSYFDRLEAGFRKSAYHTAMVAKSKMAEVPHYVSDLVIQLGRRLMARLHKIEYHRSVQHADGPLEMKLDPVVLAAANYEPLPYPSPVVLFQVAERPSSGLFDLRNAWNELIRGTFESHDIFGGHDGMFDEPFVGVLGAKMKNSLARARDKEDPPAPKFNGVMATTRPFAHRTPTNEMHR